MSDRADDVVFVHGGKHDGRYWNPTIASLARLQPDVTTLAVDLPGRRGMPGETNFSACVASAIEQIDEAGIDSMVLVGHSLAGVTLPEIATQLGARRVRRIVAVACCVPPQGKTTVDTVSLPTQLVARLLEQIPMPRWLARQMFCNGMSAEQTALSLDLLVPDAPDTPGLTRERVDRRAFPEAIPRTWVVTLRDRTLPPRVQLRFASNLGAQEIVPIDTGHNPMIADPDGLATIIATRLSPVC